MSWLRSHSASVVSSSGALEAMPAFETTMSTPPNASHRGAERGDDALLVEHVRARGDRDVAELVREGSRTLGVEVGRDDARATGRELACHGAADAAGGAGDERDHALELTGRRGERQLVELERPVLDRERLRVVERDEPAERGSRRA